jgi:hypothetical protein
LLKELELVLHHAIAMLLRNIFQDTVRWKLEAVGAMLLSLVVCHCQATVRNSFPGRLILFILLSSTLKGYVA